MAEKAIHKKKINVVRLMRAGVSLLDAAEVFLLRLGGLLALIYELLRAFFHGR